MRWTEDEINLLNIWLEQGWTHNDIGNELGRTASSVEHKALRLNLHSKNNQKKTHEQFLFEIQDKPFICLDIYDTNKVKIRFECNIDNHMWFARPDDILQGKGCPICNRRGGYNSYSVEDFQKIKEIYLYKVVLKHKKETFYKIGISINPISRYRSYSPYKVTQVLLEEKYTDAEQAFLDEQFLHSLYREYKYIPKHNFGGHTECFSIL